MPKINSLPTDKSLSKNDRLLGSDALGPTRNYKLEDVLAFIRDSNSAGVFGQLSYIYYNRFFGGNSQRPSGSMTIDTSSVNTAFNAVSTIKVSKYSYIGEDAIDNILATYLNKEIVIVDNNDPNNFATYVCGGVDQDTTETDFYDLSLTYINGEGNLTSGKVYSTLISPSIGGDSVQSDWNATSGDALILNKPTIPTDNSELTNGAGYITDGNTNWNNTYGFITEETDTLDSVTSRGNTTTDDIEVGGLHVNGDFTNYNKNATDIGQVQTSDARGYGLDYVSEKTLAYCRIGASAFDEEGAVRIKDNVFQTYMDGAWQDVVTNFRFREDENGDYELEHKPLGFEWWIEVNSGNSDNLGLNGLPIIQNYKVSMGAYPVPLEIDGGTF
jgi:hypothetical protein